MYTRFYMLMISLAIFLVGCSSAENVPSLPQEESTVLFEPVTTAISPETQLIATLQNGKLIFTTYTEQYEVYTYDVATGDKQTVHTQALPIVQMQVHPSGDTILIVSAKSAQLATVTLYSAKFDQLYEVDIPSYEVRVAFDVTNAMQFAVTAFSDSFDATVYRFIDHELGEVDVNYPFVSMRNGELYTLRNNVLQRIDVDGKTEVIAQNVAHALIASTDVYYVTEQAPETLVTAQGSVSFLQPIVSLEEQHGEVYAWVQNQQQYELTTLQDMTPLLMTAQPQPFYVDANNRYILYGHQYEWIKEPNEDAVQWLTIN